MRSLPARKLHTLSNSFKALKGASPANIKEIALIAGGGKFPIFFAKGAALHKVDVLCIGIKGVTDPTLSDLVKRMEWIEFGRIGDLFDILSKSGVRYAVLAGSVPKQRFYKKELNLDKTTTDFLDRLKDKRDRTLLYGLILKLKFSLGIKVLKSSLFMEEFIPRKGILTERPPTEREWNDIAFGRKIARKIAGLDIGQAILVKDKTVIAIEALEGTNETIKRARQLAGENLVMIKMARPRQDSRFDMPTIGFETVHIASESDVKVIAMEAYKTLFIERERALKLANDNNISIVAI